MRRSKLILCMILIFGFSTGCAHYLENAALKNIKPESGYRYKNISPGDNSDSLFVILTFSGGGTRAAAFSYGVLEKLRDTTIIWEGKEKRLLDEVDVISSVSGGSFTAAYYALRGDKVFTEFEGRFLNENIERALMTQLFYPANWFRLASPHYSRIDIAARYYDEHVFDHATFDDLRRKKPFILINATDMTLGSRFEFTQDQFDLLCSDMSGYPVARAVAASSAFPGLLSPVSLVNHAGKCGYREPGWVGNALRDRDIARARFARASQVRSYRDGKERPYIHLLDGGIADNIGLREPMYSLWSTDCPWSLLRMINLKKVHKVAIIVVNAKNETASAIDKKESPPGLLETLNVVANAPMDNYSFETIDLLQKGLDQWARDDAARKSCEKAIRQSCPQAALPGAAPHEVKFYPVVIGLDAIPDEKERRDLKNLPTSFSLPRKDTDRLRAAAGKLLDEAEGFRRLRSDLK